MALKAGTRLGPYEIIQLLGEGGMGVVYKAQDTRLKRFVAIKVLRVAALADPQRRARFVQEAQAASALNHPNIFTIYDIGEQDGIDYIAMEYVAGKTLDALIPRKGMLLSETLRIAVQIAAGLERAHAARIVHRDLKPGNVIVGDDGQVKILDFGLAKLTERPMSTDGVTETVRPDTKEGTIVGTAAYMSPEQAEGRPVDARSDIFSFGSVLYEMVTGERAFRGASVMATLAGILNAEPKPLTSIAPDVPRDVEGLVQRCLRKDPDRRFQHMDDIRIALVDLKEESDSDRLTPASAPAPAPRRRIRPWVGLAAGLLLGLSVVAWWSLRKYLAAPELRTTLLTAEPGTQTDPALSPDGKQVAYAWDADQDERSSIYVKLTDAGTPLRLTSQPGAADHSPAWSPDGRHVAFCRTSSSGSEILRVPALGGPLTWITHK
jgi:serine/threonine protein kinase